MSRGQSGQVFSTATKNSGTDQSNAQSAFGAANTSIGDYQNQLAKFVSANPYTKGGEFDATINSGLANTSDAGANSLAGRLQSQAMRTGQNSAADAATAASAAQANTRQLSSDLAQAQQQRMNAETGYNTTALQGATEPISAESGLYGTSLSGGNSALGTAEGAAQTPSFWDEVGGGLASGLGRGLSYSGGGTSVGACWVAAELYGGWDDRRVHLLRWWIFGPFAQTWRGAVLAELYHCHGRKLAWLVRRSKLARRIAQHYFDKALILAGWEAK